MRRGPFWKVGRQQSLVSRLLAPIRRHHHRRAQMAGAASWLAGHMAGRHLVRSGAAFFEGLEHSIGSTVAAGF